MKLTTDQLEVINKYIDPSIIDRAKLVQYLEKHALIKKDVFRQCSLLGKKWSMDDEAYCGFLDHDSAFQPTSRKVFIRRIPILFHCPMRNDQKGHRSGLWHILPSAADEVDPDALEALYLDLEYMFYDLGLSMECICGYSLEQVFRRITYKKNKRPGSLFEISTPVDDEMFGIRGEMKHEELFQMWRHYLHLCADLGWTDYTPERFITKYNLALEAAGLEPIIYRPLLQYGVYYFTRKGTSFICKGHFPCDDEGKPILRWTGIRVENPKAIRFNGVLSRAGTLEIELQADTTIYFWGEDNFFDDDDPAEPDDEWHQIYAGPLNMEFDYESLKFFRKQRGMTQKEVADAIGANVRTYQKWESGDSTPDGHYLLRIMNWLDIQDVQDIISYTSPQTAKGGTT